jgi:hypothetical protein
MAAPQGGAFTSGLDEKSLAAFSTASKKPFSEQAQFFLNAFWDEYGNQAECIYSVSFEVMKKADMRWRNVTYVHLYEEGNDLDFDMGLYFFEQLNKFYDGDDKVIPGLKGPEWKRDFPASVPAEMTAVVRKKELRDKVDVNFDGRVSFLEYLLYQYNASPKDLMDRQTPSGLPAEVLAAMAALAEVNKRVQAYETEKARLEAESQGDSGIKVLKAKNELAQLVSGPLWEQINKALITAEAAVRIAQRKYGGAAGAAAAGGNPRVNGTMWWLDRELKTKKERYAPRGK